MDYFSTVFAHDDSVWGSTSNTCIRRWYQHRGRALFLSVCSHWYRDAVLSPLSGPQEVVRFVLGDIGGREGRGTIDRSRTLRRAGLKRLVKGLVPKGN